MLSIHTPVRKSRIETGVGYDEMTCLAVVTMTEGCSSVIDGFQIEFVLEAATVAGTC